MYLSLYYGDLQQTWLYGLKFSCISDHLIILTVKKYPQEQQRLFSDWRREAAQTQKTIRLVLSTVDSHHAHIIMLNLLLCVGETTHNSHFTYLKVDHWPNYSDIYCRFYLFSSSHLFMTEDCASGVSSDARQLVLKSKKSKWQIGIVIFLQHPSW